MGTRIHIDQLSESHDRKTLVLLLFRIFTICAIIVSAALEFFGSNTFNTPVEQIGISAGVGFGAVVLALAAKGLHFF